VTDEDGYRNLQQNGGITVPKEFRDEHDLEPGDEVKWKRHSRDRSKLILFVD
jgi:bifunctional DNA-binding transcriptional regulator/antitoxin component of YhaV-PrlF toxin-antitoxin module